MKKIPFTEHRVRRNPFRVIGTYLHLVIILGIALPAAIYLGVMQLLGWRVPVVGMNAVAVSRPADGSVILYASDSTKNYFGGIGANYEVLLVPWRNYFANRKLDFTELRSAAQLRKQKEGVLILPSAVALNEEERSEILSFRAKGGSVLTTWATGARNGSGEWDGWRLLETLGVKMLGEISPTAETHNLILNGESPLSHTQAAGRRIWMSKTSEKLLRLKGEMVAARFMNWARITDDERRAEGAIVYTEAGASYGRAASFAFAESAWESHPLPMYDVIDDTIRWLQREPAIVLAAWPKGKTAAQVIEMDTEQGFPNAIQLASMMQSINYRGTFYVLTSVGKQFPDVLGKLARDFEIAYHGDVHDGFKGQSEKVQTQRLQTMRKEMGTVVTNLKTVTGFRAPTERYDGTTEQLLPKFGIRHHAADPERSEARLPLVVKPEATDLEDALVVLPRTQRDDINLALEKLSADQTRKALIDDFDHVLETGALGFLSVHSQNFGADAALPKAMPGFLEHVQRNRAKLWLASAGEVADWWRNRERVKVSANNTGRRTEFNLTIVGKKPVSGASLILMLPQKDVLPSVQGTKTGMVKPVVSKIDEYRASIVFDTLEPGNYSYQATFSQ